MTTVINGSQAALFDGSQPPLAGDGGSATGPRGSAALRGHAPDTAPPSAPHAEQNRRRVGPASFGQASLWFVRQLMPHKSAYNTAVELPLAGDLDAAALLAAVHEIVLRHEGFRTTFTTAEGTVLQVVTEGMAADVLAIDLSSSPEPEAEAQRLAREMAAAQFDLDHGPLLRVRLLQLRPRDYRLVVVVDHIVADGMSLGILWREIEVFYRIFHASGVTSHPPAPQTPGGPLPLLPPAKQPASCIEAQNRWLATPAFARQLQYWTNHLAGAAPCDLPEDRPRPPERSYRGDLAVIEIPAALTAGLSELSARHEVSLFASLLAGLDVLLARYSGQRDVVVMVPVACRRRLAAESVIGHFANMIVLRTEVAATLGFDELIQSVNKEIMAGVLREDVPFEKVVEALRPERSLSHDPLARIALSFLPAHAAELELPGVKATFRELPNGGSKFDLHLVIIEHGGHLDVSAEYNSDVFDARTIEALLEHYLVLLASACAAPAQPVGDLPILTAADQRGLVAWNDTARSYPTCAVHELFGVQAARDPDAVALRFEGREMSYAELDRRSSQVARCLRARGVGSEDYVGVAVERSIPMVVGILGILKAGGAYVPLDPAYPRDRLALMAADSGLRMVFTEDRFADIIPRPANGILRVDGDAGEIAAQNDAPLDLAIQPESRAYVIYTSGSTGRPKGVQIPHRAVVNFLSSMAERPGLSTRDRVLAVTSLSFDIAGLEIWLPLTVGAQVEIASRGTAGDGAKLRRLLETGGITLMQATPSTFRLLLEAGWEGTPGLKVLVGGEATPRELADKLLDRAASVWNMYGPTETTIWSCIQRLQKSAPVLIGRPIDNTRTHILDQRGNPVPAGVTGELYIGGDGLAHGYLGRPDLTSQRFVPDPFHGRGSGRLYRTGDLCRRRRDGAIEFLGRADFQVKLHGHRIEPGEIEAALVLHPAIREALVVVFEETPGDQKLAAYVTAREVAPRANDLRSHLRATLPGHMVPARFIVLEKLPRTANNKIDRTSLPPPSQVAAAPAAAESDDKLPHGALETKLCAIWEQVLGVHGIGVHDNFFELGGHSLLALRLFDRISRAFGVNLPIASLLQAPTIAGLGHRLRQEGWAPRWSSLVPIQTAGTRRPLFCVHAIGGNVLNYRLLSKHLGDQQPLYGLQARGLSGNEAPHATVEEMAAGYIHEMRQEHPRGPYQLCGASSGGVIAFEMAQQLHAAGERVSALVMLDTYRVGPPPDRVVRALASSPVHGLGMRLDVHFGQLLTRTPREGFAYLAGRLRARFGDTEGPLAVVLEGATPAVRHVVLSHQRALGVYVPRPYPGSVVMLLSRDVPNRASSDGRLIWADLLEQGLILRFIPGSHENMLDEPQVATVAATVASCLDRV